MTSTIATSASFTEIPLLRLSEAFLPETKPTFLVALRNALLNVGFLYISDTGLPEDLVQRVIDQCHAFFETLPEQEKLNIEMKNEKSFLGYSRLGNEVTAGKADWREQLDLVRRISLVRLRVTTRLLTRLLCQKSTNHPTPSATAPIWYNMLGPNQWPTPTYLPEFRSTYEEYIRRMSVISMTFTSLIAEALGLRPEAFSRFFDADQQHKLKLVKYPDASTDSAGQGVGPHKDSMLTSYLLQASPHKGLQAQNIDGRWIDCPPKPGTLVVAIGQGMEALTGGVCASTTHRVLSPEAGLGARYSVPFFQGVSFDARFEDFNDEIPEWIRKMKEDSIKRSGGRQDSVEFTFVKGKWKSLGEATLMNRVKSHPDVGQRWVRHYSGHEPAVTDKLLVSRSFGADPSGAASPKERCRVVAAVTTIDEDRKSSTSALKCTPHCLVTRYMLCAFKSLYSMTITHPMLSVLYISNAESMHIWRS